MIKNKIYINKIYEIELKLTQLLNEILNYWSVTC